MLWLAAALGLTLLVGYIIHTLVTSSGSDYASNSFEAFLDDTSALQTTSDSVGCREDIKAKNDKYKRTYDQPGRQILIIYGTEYGFSEELAKELFNRIEVCKSSADQAVLQPRIINAKNFALVDLLQESCVFVVMSTAGDGVPPNDAKDFVTWLLKSQLVLSHLRYSVLALGDSNYVHYCRAGKNVEIRLRELGAQPIEDRKDVDSEDMEAVEQWFTNVLRCLESIDIEPKFDYLQNTESDGIDSSVPSRERPFWSTLKTKYNLTRNSNSNEGEKETVHCEFDVAGGTIVWTSGDALGIYPQNNPIDVNTFLAVTKRSGTELVPVPRSAYHLETEDLLPLRNALQHFYDLKNVKPELLTLFHRHALLGSPDIKLKLDNLLKDGIFKTNSCLQEYLCQHEVTDVLEEFREISAHINTADILGQMKGLLPRYYSISSSPVVDSTTICVTVAVVRYQTLGKNRGGVTTTFLQDRFSISQSCPVFISKNPNFRLPLDPGLPIIMIGPGTGLAPFRAFIQERTLQASGLNLLYFGCRQKEQDFLYRTELENLVKMGKLELRTAFSRDQQQKIYVQDLLREDSIKIWELLSAGAHLYVCGDAKHMAHDVHGALVDIARNTGKMTEEEAEIFLSSLEMKGRYEKDTWVS